MSNRSWSLKTCLPSFNWDLETIYMAPQHLHKYVDGQTWLVSVALHIQLQHNGSLSKQAIFVWWPIKKLSSTRTVLKMWPKEVSHVKSWYWCPNPNPIIKEIVQCGLLCGIQDWSGCIHPSRLVLHSVRVMIFLDRHLRMIRTDIMTIWWKWSIQWVGSNRVGMDLA